LFTIEDLSKADEGFQSFINPNSLQLISKVYIESSLKEATHSERYQFIRKGYFCLDKDSTPQHLIFNRTVTLKDTWVKEQKK